MHDGRPLVVVAGVCVRVKAKERILALRCVLIRITAIGRRIDSQGGGSSGKAEK